jgi:hypothetical protein
MSANTLPSCTTLIVFVSDATGCNGAPWLLTTEVRCLLLAAGGGKDEGVICADALVECAASAAARASFQLAAAGNDVDAGAASREADPSTMLVRRAEDRRTSMGRGPRGLTMAIAELPSPPPLCGAAAWRGSTALPPCGAARGDDGAALELRRACRTA